MKLNWQETKSTENPKRLPREKVAEIIEKEGQKFLVSTRKTLIKIWLRSSNILRAKGLERHYAIFVTFKVKAITCTKFIFYKAVFWV